MKKHYYAIDIMKYICAIFVVIVHTSPLLPVSEIGNFALNNILGRFAVPFFFISSGYFVKLNIDKKGDDYFKVYIKNLIKIYLFWSVLYIPCGITWINENLSLPVYLYPVALLVAIFYIGTYYPLWYMPALILSLIFVHWYTKKFRHRSLLPIAFLLFCIGALETYYGVIHNPFILSVIDNYMKVFFTTRNVVFYGLFYVACGFYLAKKDRAVKIKYAGLGSLIFFLLTVYEASRLFRTNSLDFNFLFMVAPFTICFFEYLRGIEINWKLNYHKLRSYCELYYFTHGFFLVLIPMTLSLFNKHYIYENDGIFRFSSVMLCTHILSSCIYHIKLKRNHKQLTSN